MVKKEQKFKVNMSFNDLIKKTLSDSDTKVISEKDKEVIITKKTKLT